MTTTSNIEPIRSVLEDALDEAGVVIRPTAEGPNWLKWELAGRAIVMLRVNMVGELTFDPYWRDEDGWDHYFAPKEFSNYRHAGHAIAQFLAYPTRETALHISALGWWRTIDA